MATLSGEIWTIIPVESITEHLISRIGAMFGFDMAETTLYLIRGELRLFSKYFLIEDQFLMHGAQIIATYLNDPMQEFVGLIEEKKLEKEFFTYQVIINAIEYVFPEQAKKIIEALFSLLLFDAIVGNKDRHHYNWGVITDVSRTNEPRLSPIYDSARGLFWNLHDQKIRDFFGKRNVIDKQRLMGYLNKSIPIIGWEGKRKVNHFELVKLILGLHPSLKNTCSILVDFDLLENVYAMMDREFKLLMTDHRFRLIKECLKLRLHELIDIFNH